MINNFLLCFYRKWTLIINLYFLLTRIPQPEFLGALVQFFSRKHDAINGTIEESIPQKKFQPIVFGTLVNYIRVAYPEYVGEMFEAYFYATAIVLSIAATSMMLHAYR